MRRTFLPLLLGLAILIPALSVGASPRGATVGRLPVVSGSISPGHTLTFSADPTSNMRTISAKATYDGVTLLFSDDPERISSPGIAYQDYVYGKFRLFIYHEVTDASPLYIGAIVTNVTSHTVGISLSHDGVAGPSGDFLAVGKLAIARWFQPVSRSFNLAPHASAFIDAAMDNTAVHNGAVINGIIDAHASGLVKVSIVAQSAPVASISGLTILPNNHPSAGGAPMRGAFQYSQMCYTFRADASGNGQYVADFAGKGSYLVGTSRVDKNARAVDVGNYGVLYHTLFVLTPSSSTTAHHAAILVNPRSGAFATTSNVYGLGHIAIPSDRPSVSQMTQAVVFNNVALTAGQSITETVDWMPAGDASLPVDLLVYPNN